MINNTTDTRKDAWEWWESLPEFTKDEYNTRYWFDTVETIYKAEHPPLPTTVEEDKEVDLMKQINTESEYSYLLKEENEKLREANTVLLEALNGLMEGNEQDPNNPLRWWQRITPKQDALNKALIAIEQANNSLNTKQD